MLNYRQTSANWLWDCILANMANVIGQSYSDSKGEPENFQRQNLGSLQTDSVSVYRNDYSLQRRNYVGIIMKQQREGWGDQGSYFLFQFCSCPKLTKTHKTNNLLKGTDKLYCPILGHQVTRHFYGFKVAAKWRYPFNYMFIIEVCSGVELDRITYRGVSKVLTTNINKHEVGWMFETPLCSPAQHQH